jgi:AraC-like DNA-binding protein
MTGPAILIISIVAVLIVGFALTILYVNSQTNSIVKANQQLVESQMALMEKNKRQEATIGQQSEQIELQHEQLEEQQSMMSSQQEQTTQLLHDLAELKEQLHAKDVVAQLRDHADDKQFDMKQLKSMSDDVLLAWIDERMEQTRLFCNPNLTLKEVSNTLGLTQKRLQQLLKNDSRYRNLSGYLNEKRFLLACRLLRDEPQWTIEAVAKEVGFSNRLMLHEMMKKYVGLTPAQYRDTAL